MAPNGYLKPTCMMSHGNASRSVRGPRLLEHYSSLLIPLRIHRGICLIRQDFFQSSVHVHILRRMCPRITPRVDSMTKVDGQEDWDSRKCISRRPTSIFITGGIPDVSSHETADRPILRPEHIKAIDQREEDEANDSAIRSPWLEPAVVVRQHLVRDTLCFACFVET